MNFFEHQDQARRNTKQLIALLVLAVLSLIAITSLLFAFFFYYLQTNNSDPLTQPTPVNFWIALLHSMPLMGFVWIALGITTAVTIGSLYKYMQLQGGGHAVAQAMGGRRLLGDTQDADERKILNVVEEMAIASGTSVPPVYILEEDGINAFAAGFSPHNAVIGITRGCIHLLNRDELQGVVAHEFSHIFHGDMRLNMRLVALLHGILLLGLIGEFLLRSSSYRSYSGNRKNSNGAILGFGLGLIVIGYAGTFFGKLIKAAVSRQREFLADASAVQFTRNPAGIAGALKKIGANASGSQLTHNHAAEFSHMYFSQGINNFFQLMATHPPLANRIKRIEPQWDGELPSLSQNRHTNEASVIDKNNAQREHSNTDAHTILSTALGGALIAERIAHLNTTELIETIAQPTQAHLDYAQARLQEIPTELKTAAQYPQQACALVWGLIADKKPAARAEQWLLLEQAPGQTEFAESKALADKAAALPANLRLPLIELALPALKQLTPNRLRHFLHCMQLLMRADQKISLTEWSLYSIVLHNTAPPSQRSAKLSLSDLQPQCHLLVSLFAWAGATAPAAAEQAFARALEQLPLIQPKLLPQAAIAMSDLDRALAQLNKVSPLQKPQLLKALGECVIADGKVSVTEAELLRAIADCLDCPLPPLLDAHQ